MRDKVYWKAVASILEVAELVGPENLPDLPAPGLDGRVVMDACAEVGRYGRQVLALARAQAQGPWRTVVPIAP